MNKLKTKVAPLAIAAIVVIGVGSWPIAAQDQSFSKPIASQLPMYPEMARAARVAGTVSLRFVVTAEGDIAEAQVRSGNPMLRDSALATVKSWKFPKGSIRPNVEHHTYFIHVLRVQPNNGEPKLTVSIRDFRKVEIVSERYAIPIE